MEDNLNLSMFRAYDIRTPAEALSPELARRLSAAEAVYFRDVLGVSGVLVAHDARSTGPQYLSLATDEYLRAGLDVLHLSGVSSTSYFYFAAMCHSDRAAVMFGASHNPAGDTGQKALGPAVTPIAAGIGPAGGLDKIKELYRAGAACRTEQRGRIRGCDVLEEYIEHSLRLADVEPGSLRGTRVLHDYLFGAAGREMMLAFDRAEADLTPLHFVADGSFPLGDPNPVKQQVIREGLDALAGGDFSLAAFFDGDGDRIDIYGGDGRYLSSSFVYAAVLPEIRRRFAEETAGVFADLKCNPLAIAEMARTGVTVDVIRNGHSQIKQSLIDDPTHFGCVEESAHFYEAFALRGAERFCTENTLYIALLIARVWQDDPERLARMFELQATTARQREWGYKFATDNQRAAALAAVQQHFERQGARSLTRMKSGMDLEATLLRYGLPFDVGPETRLADDWLQVCQRISQSEDRLARWEVSGARNELVQQAKREIAECVAQYGAGEEYQG